jgi:hypothetical protein
MNFMPAAAAQQDAALRAAMPASAAQVGVRPEHWLPGSAGDGLAITVMGSEYLGAQRLVQGRLGDGTKVELLMEGGAQPVAGALIHMTPQPQRWHAFDSAGQRITRG